MDSAAAGMFDGADAAEADLPGLPPTTEDADNEAEQAEVVSEDELMESGDEEEEVQVVLSNIWRPRRCMLLPGGRSWPSLMLKCVSIALYRFWEEKASRLSN